MIDNTEIENLRRSYSLRELTEATVNKDPFEQFSQWMEEAVKSDLLDANAMVLATSDKKGFPSARVVLLKGIDDKSFVFYTNYESHKGSELSENPNAALLFFWKELERQVRITGRVEKISKDKSEKYFHSRPYDSQIGAFASEQSSVIPNREFLENKFTELRNKYDGKEIPLPEFWGGYKLIPNYFEFWQGRESRLHDRIVYLPVGNSWKTQRLSP